MTSTLVRPQEGRRVAGVAAGVADRFGWSRSAVRLAMVVSIVLPGPQVLAYLAGWIVIPDEGASANGTRELDDNT